MIKSIKLFFISLLMLLIMMVLGFHFPHNHPLGEELLQQIGLPRQTASGFLPVGIIQVVLFMIGIYLYHKSLTMYRTRMTILAITIVFAAPSIILSSYQATFAKGINTISYHNEGSSCTFEMIDNNTLQGNCELLLKNYSSKNQTFTIKWNEHEPFDEEDVRMLTLMNLDGPYETTLGPKEHKTLYIERKIDISSIENHIVSGSTNGVPITIQADGKSRNL